MYGEEVTVAILAYYKEFLRECIESVLAQTYENIKVIVYDDCSPQNLQEIVDVFSDSRLHYVRNDRNLGGGENFNKAMRLCDTKYINIFHGDDRMLPWMIDELVKVFENHPSVGIVATSGVAYIGNDNTPRFIWKKQGKLYKQNEWVKYFCKKASSAICPPSVMHRKAFFDKVPPRKTGSVSDTLYWLVANNLGIEFYILNIPLLEYRLHDINVTNMMTLERWLDVYKEVSGFLIRKGFEYGIDNYKKFFSHYILSVLGLKCSSMSDIFRLKKTIECEMKCLIPQKNFSNIAAICFLGQDIIKVSRGEETVSFFFKKMTRLSREGLNISWERKMKWFVKYILLKKG